jgi:uncharacterized protein
VLDLVSQLGKDFVRLDRRTVFALVYAAFGLTCINFLKDTRYFEALLSSTTLAHIGREAASPTVDNLYALTWWVAVSLVFYFVIPAAWITFAERKPLSDFGLAARMEPGFGRLLAVCVAVMLPLTYLMSLTAGFANKYPFLQVYDGSPYFTTTLLVWEFIYFLQFFGLEFFFRGFLLHSLKPQLGIYSILVMTVPYTMIHFQKPFAEAIAAIIAGIFLGWISYRNGTIWLGLLLHCTVAFSMDILALWNKGLIFN